MIHPESTIDECMEEIGELEREIEWLRKAFQDLANRDDAAEIERLRSIILALRYVRINSDDVDMPAAKALRAEQNIEERRVREHILDAEFPERLRKGNADKQTEIERLTAALYEATTNGRWTEGEQRGEWAITSEVYKMMRRALEDKP